MLYSFRTFLRIILSSFDRSSDDSFIISSIDFRFHCLNISHDIFLVFWKTKLFLEFTYTIFSKPSSSKQSSIESFIFQNHRRRNNHLLNHLRLFSLLLYVLRGMVWISKQCLQKLVLHYSTHIFFLL